MRNSISAEIILSIILCMIWGCNPQPRHTSGQAQDSIHMKQAVISKDTLYSLQDTVLPGSFTNNFPLPKITRVIYHPVSTRLEHIFPKDASYPAKLQKFLTHYNNRLPDIGAYHCYDVIVNCSNDSTATSICPHNYTQGLMVLFDPKTGLANVLNVSYDMAVESEHYEMWYSIDKGTSITLTETGETEGEGGVPEALNVRRHFVKVDNNRIEISDLSTTH